MHHQLAFALLLVAVCLSTACEKSPKQARRELVKKGYSFARDSFAESLRKADSEAVDLFLLAGMDPNVISGGYAALEHAAFNKSLVQVLLQAGADPNTSGGVTTPLVEAAAQSDSATVALLLDSGADPNLSDATDSTPLMAASKRGELTIVSVLLQADAHVNQRSKLGSSALALARAGGHEDVVSALQKAGAQDQRGPNLAALMDPSRLNKSAPSHYLVNVTTSAGPFTVEVERTWAPNAADRFYNLVVHGYFDDQRFFRVVAGRLVQFGLHGVPEIAARWYDATLPDDPVQFGNSRGTLAFASEGTAHSRTTQIFVNLSDNDDFDRMGLVPFGRIVQGIRVIDQIHAEYGELPEQSRIIREGNDYLERSFPSLDKIGEARLSND